MTDYVKRLNTAATWVIAVALSVLGVLAVSHYAQSRDDQHTTAPNKSLCVEEAVETTSTTTPVPTTVSTSASTTTTYPPTTTTLPPPRTYIDKDGNEHEGPPATLPPTTWRALELDTCEAVTVADLKFGDEICVVSLRDNGHFDDYRFVEVIEVRPTISGQELPSYAHSSEHLVVVDWGDSEELFYDTYYSEQFGLDGNRVDRRTFAGTCASIMN